MNLKSILQAVRAGQVLFRSFVKTPSQTTASGIWFDLSMSPGNPVPQYYFATPLVGQALSRSADWGLDHGPAKPGMVKLIHRLLLQIVTATATPLSLRLLDYLMFYPGIAMDVGTQDLATPTPLARSADGRGVQMMLVEQSSYVGGATLRVNYTNQDGVPGRWTPVVTCNTQTASGTIATSAPATAGCCGPFLPLASGDCGVRSVEQIEFLTGDVGLLALVLVRPVAPPVCVYENTAAAEMDFLTEFGWMPHVEDDSYLNFIAKPVGTLAAAPIAGDLQTIWGTP